MTREAIEVMPSSAAARHQRNVRLPRTYLIVAAVLPLVLLGLLSWRLAVMSPASASLIGSPAPEFALSDLNGNPIRLADLRGRPVIVNFWASWCGPCVEEFPLLQRALEQHRADGLAVIGIVVQDRSEAARAFMSRMGAGWPAVMDPDGSLADSYDLYAPPESFFVDRNGLIASRQVGQLSQADLSRQLSAILPNR
jgi:cytochrome c biogenesis protein CcmG/thiol:disulfide interchange protein DsbE